MSEASAAYAPLHYVLLFPLGEFGWHWNIPLTVPDGNHRLVNDMDDKDPEGDLPVQQSGRKQVSQIEYYAYCLFQRLMVHNCVLKEQQIRC